MIVMVYSNTIEGMQDTEQRFRKRFKTFDLLRTIGKTAAEKNIQYAGAVVYDGDSQVEGL